MKNEKEMKKVNVNDSKSIDSPNRWLKNIGLCIFYWILFIGIFILVPRVWHINMTGHGTLVIAMLILLLLFIPFLTFFLSKFANLYNKSEKKIFVVVGSSVPMLFISAIVVLIYGLGNLGF